MQSSCKQNHTIRTQIDRVQLIRFKLFIRRYPPYHRSYILITDNFTNKQNAIYNLFIKYKAYNVFIK